jgi:hypothetical protein
MHVGDRPWGYTTPATIAHGVSPDNGLRFRRLRGDRLPKTPAPAKKPSPKYFGIQLITD